MICWELLIFSPIHEFLDLHIFISHNLNIPPGTSESVSLPTEESAFYWTGLNKGFEGLRQKAWTLVTTTILLVVTRRSGCKMSITGQGDNQVIQLMIPKENTDLDNTQYVLQYETQIFAIINNVMDILEEVSADMGLPIKRDETWISMYVFAYGKEILVKGAFFPGSLKKIGCVYFRSK